MADKDNKSKLTYHVWDKDNNEYDIPDEVVQQRGMDNFAKDFEGGYITMFDDKKQKVDVPIEDVGEYRKQGYIWYDTSGNATPINEVGKKPSPSSSSQGTEQSQYPQEVLDAFNSPDNKPGNFKDLAQLNDEYQRGELKKPSLISQVLGMMPKVDAGNIGREQKMGGMITSMLLGGNEQQAQPMQQPQDNNQQVQQTAQGNASQEQKQEPAPSIPSVVNDNTLMDAKFANYLEDWKKRPDKEGDYFENFVADLEAEGMNPEEATQATQNALNRYANRSALEVTNKVVSSLADDTVQDAEKNIEAQWYSHDVQDKLKQEASAMGVSYDDYVAHYLKPAMVESLVQKYGQNYRNIAEGIATRLYSHDEHVQDRLMNQDINDALSDVISKYVNPSVVDEYNKAQEAGSKAFNEGMEGSQNIPASLRLGTAIASQYEANQAKDPQKTLSALQKKFNGLYKNPQFLNDMSNAVFKVMQRYGMNGTLSGNPKQFKPMIDEVLKAQLNQLEVKNMIPKGSSEYIMNTGLGNTIVGKITRKLVQTDYQNWLEDIANQQYQPGFWERVGSGALTFAGDAWSYWLPGAAGGKVTKSMLAKAEGRLASDLMAKGMEAKMAERAAKVLIGKSKGMALKTGAAHGAVTFGGQSAISKPIDEIYRTGQLDENGKVYNPSVGKILANTLGEVAKQSAVGAIMQGGTIANMVGKGRGLATNVLADVGGKVVDSSIMTGQQMLERMAQDPSFKPTGKDAAESFLESMANLTSIGLPGMVGKYARFKDAKEFNRKFDFNDRDIAELKRFGYDDLRDAFEKLGINGYRAEGEGVQMMGQLTDKYMNLMNDKSVPEVLKAKMMAVVEGKRPSSFSPVIDSIIVQPMDNDGKVYLETLNKDGGIIDRKEYSSLEEAQKAEKKLDFEKSLNITSEYEKAYHTDALQDRLNTIYEQARDKYAAGEQLNDEDKAAIYLHQNASAIGDIMQKQQKGMELTEQEQQMVNSYRHFYDSAFENSPIMKEYVRTFEDSQGVEHGTLRKALEGDGKSRTAEQQKLVEEYQKQLYNDIVLKREMNDAKEQMNQNLIEGQRELPGATQEGGASAQNAEATAEKPVDASVSSDVPPTEPPTPPVGGETPTNAEGAPLMENGASPSDANTASNESKSNAYVMGQNAYQNGDVEGLKAIDHNDDVSKARLKRAFGDDEAQMNVVVKAYEDGKDMEQFVAQRANSMTPAQQDAVRKYVEAQDAKKGVYDALQHADDGYGDALKELLWTYQTEDGNIVPATLTTGQQVFLKKANEYGGGFVVVPDEDGNPAIKQVSSADIKEVGTPVPMDDYINQQVTEQKNARQQQFFAQYDGSGLKPSDIVEVAMEAGEEPMQMTFAGYSEDGKIVLSDGKDNIALTKDEFNTWRQNALDASIGAELDAEDAQRANDDAAKAEADKKQRYNEGIVGLGMGQPDYSSKDTEPKVAAEYLQEQFGNDHGKLMNLISGSRSDIKEQLDNKRKAASEYEDWLSLNADLDPEKAQKVENDLALVNEQIADLETRYKNWNAIRKEVMTPEEARILKNERKAEIEKAGVDENAITSADEREVAVLDNKELKKQYPTMDEASNYIASERKRIYHIQNDEVQPQIDGINEALEQYMNDDIDYSADQLKELNTTKAQLEARQANLSASAKDLKAQDKLLNTLYSAENKEERAKAMEELTPSEQRKVLVADALKKNDLGSIKEIYKDASIDVMDLTPQTLEEAVSEALSPHSLNAESLQAELGKNNFKYGIGKGYDSNKFNYLLAKKGTGLSVNEFAVRVYNDLPVNLWDMGYSDQDVRNTLLDMFKSYDNVKDMRNVALMNRIAAAEEELSAEEEWYEAQKEREIIERQAEIEEYNSYIQDKTLSLPSESELNAIEGMEYDRMMEAEEREREYKEYVKSILPEIADYDDRSNEEGYGGSSSLGSESSRRGVDEGNRQGEEISGREASSQSETGESTDSGRTGRQETGSMEPGEGSVVRGAHLPQEASFGERLKNAIAETEPNPSEAQKKAGNYKKGHLSFGGYDFTVETPKGTTRSGKDEQGKPWSVTMHDTYGYILGKIGVDGDHIDMFINDGADLDSFDGNVYVVDQVNPETGEFDEHKVMYGYPSEEAATEAYLANYSKGWKGLGKVTSVPMATFDKWLESSDRKTKPFADYAMIKKNANQNFISDMEYTYENDVHPSEEDKPKMQKFAERLLDFHQDREDKPEYGYTMLSSNIKGDKLYPNEKKWFGTKKYRQGVSWVDKENACAYELNPRFNAQGYLTAVGVHKLVPLASFNRDIKEVKPSEMTEAQKVAFDAVSTMLKKAGIPVKVISNEEMEKVAEGGRVSFMRTYHGSGADFTEFDFDYMGEGAGSQAFGWGGYVTSSKEIGKSYATMMDNDGTRLYMGRVYRSAVKFKNKYPTLDSFMSDEKVQERFKRNQFTEKEVEEYYNERLKDAEPYHNMYEVDIPDDNGKNYLNWYGDAPKKLVDRVKKDFGISDEDAKHVMDEYNGSGQGLYRLVSMFSGDTRMGSDKEASKYLSSLGFTGIKYPAGTIMGGAEKGDMNYVIFNPGDMKIEGHTKFAKNKGTVFGYTDGNQIVLNQDHLNPNTPIHEYQHIWRTAAKELNPDLIKHGDDLIRKTSLYERVKSDPNYSHLSDEEICDEAFARLVGQDGEQILEDMANDAIKENPLDTAKELSVINKLKEWLKKFWYWTLETFTKWKPEDIKKMTLEDIRNLVLRDLAQGVDPRTVLKGQMTKDEAVSLRQQMADNAEPERILEHTEDNWLQDFGKDGRVNTPIGSIKLGENQYKKAGREDRIKRFGLLKPTLERPDVILEKPAPKEGAERQTKYLFVKSFKKVDGTKILNFESITVKQGEDEVSISAHQIEPSKLLKELTESKMLWNRFRGDSNSLGENQGSALTPSANNPSGKDSVLNPHSDAKIRNSFEITKENGGNLSVEDKIKAVSQQFGVDEADVAMYANAIKKGSTAEAARARANINRHLMQVNEGNIFSLKDVVKYTKPINEALKVNFGDVDAMIEERRKQVEAERNAMEAARKRAEEEEAKRKKHLEELSLIPEDKLDKQYMDALAKGDDATAREMLDEAARRKGYDDTESAYQGVGAWAAPGNPGYESDKARRDDWESSGSDVNLEDMALGYTPQPDDYFSHPERYSQNTPHGLESVKAINTAIDAIKNGEKDVKVKVYRAVPTSVKEGKLRNGDWVTPSRKYAEIHGTNRLEGKYRIIEDEVPATQLWWDGNDANEFGFDDGKEYKYKNAKNNRKLNDLVTYDDEGDVIPPSKRFNSRKSDIRFMFAGEKGAAEADKADEQTIRMDNLDVAKQMEEEKKDAKIIKMATGWEKGVDGKWRYEMPDVKIKDTIDVGGGNIVKRFDDDMLWNDGNLSDVIDAPGLFEAYPQLKNVRIDTDAIMNDMPSNGDYNAKTNTITIHADELKYMNSILNHEIQHAIQHIEGFARGGSPRLIRGEVKKKFNEVTKQIMQLRAEGKEDEAKALVEKNRGLYNAYQKNDDYNSYKSLAGEVEARNVQSRMGMTDEERKNSLAEETEDVNRDEQIVMNVGDTSYSIVKDPETIKKLDKDDTVKVYRAMQVGEDGKLYPPMAAKVKGKFVEPIELGKWEQADERPELADDKGMFTLNKGNGKSLKAAYNPYLHTSRTPLNDQFSEAQNRPNIVTVEVEVPKSELTSGYKADKAKDAVGEVEWKAGIIQGQLTGKRKVVLSRWDKPVRIVPDSEVADVIVNDMFKGKNITMPSNVVTPSLRKELEKRGVPFVETDNRGRIVGGENDGLHYSKVYGKKANVKPRLGSATIGLKSAKDKVVELFNKAKSGEFNGKPQSIGTLTQEGKKFLEDLSGLKMKDKIDFVLNPSDLKHMNKDHFGNNEKDPGRNIPLTEEDLRSMVDVIMNPEQVVYGIEKMDNRKAFFFLKQAEDGTLNLAEIYSDKKGNLTAKSYYKTKKGVDQRVMEIKNSLLPTPEASSGSPLSDGKGINFFSIEQEKTAETAENERKIADSVVNTANKLGGAEATVYSSLDDVPEEYRSEVEQGAKGWYDPETHTVHVYLPNCEDGNDAQRTVFHEKIGHEGMEVLLGGEQGVRKFADFVYKSVDKKTRGKILDFAHQYDPGWNNPDRINIGTQEYIAHLAEEGPTTAEDFSLWTKIKHYLIKVLKKLGIRVPGLLNDKDLRYYLMKAGKALHVWDNMPKEKQEAMMAQASNAEIKDALADGAGKGKPHRKKGESEIAYIKRRKEWERWKIAREDTEDPEPPMFYDFDKDAEGKKEWERLNKKWRDEHHLQGDEMPTKPERKEGETDKEFFPRYKEWEKWDNAIADKENPMPDMFAFEKQKQDKARKEYEAWLTRHELNEQNNADLDLYEGKIYPAETNPEADALEQRVMQDLAEVTSTDVSKEGAATTVKHAVIHRRKNMEEASADDAIYINDVKNSIEKMAESGAFDKLLSDYQGKPNKAEKLAEAIPYIIEAPRRIREIAYKLNSTGVFGEGHIHITPNDVEAIQELRPKLAEVTANTHTEIKDGKEVKLFDDMKGATEVASKVADIINGNHEKEPGFVPIDGTDILNKNVLPIILNRITPYGVDYKNLSEPMKSVLDSIRDWYNYTFDWLKDNNTLKADTGFTVDYVNHLWDKEKSDKNAYAMYVENRQRTKSPNEKPRQINTIMEGLEVGLVPKTTDITKMMAYYSRSNIEAWANKTMLQEVSGLNVIERNEDGEIISSDPLLSSVAPFNLEQYKYFEIPGVGPVWVYNVSPKQMKVKNPITGKEKVLYSEASAGDRFGVVFDTYQSTPFWKAFDTLASSMKKLELGFSGFHAGALTEVYMVQNMTEFGPKKALANFMKYIFVDTMKNHQLPCFANPQDFQEAATHLVKFGATNDYAAADVQNMFDNWRDFAQKLQQKLEERGKIGMAVGTATIPFEVATQMVSMLNKGMDVALWDFLHDGLKLATYRMRADRTKERAKKYGWTDEQLGKALDEDGQFVNDMFGGQHWDVLGASHRTLRYAGRVLLSPDWNASTTRHFLALTGYGSVWNEATFENFKNYYKNVWAATRGKGKLAPDDWGRLSRQLSALLCYGIGFMIFYEGFANAFNAAFRALDEEKERKKAEELRKTNPNYRSPYELAYPDGMKWYDYLMRGNSLGQQSKIFMGRYADGTEMYIRHGKQFREVPEYLFNHKGELEFPGPMVQRMIGKANPMVRMTLDDINYLSDFQASHADQEIQRKYGKAIGLLYKDALYWAPFLIPSQENKEFKAVDFFFPSSKGFSPWKAQSYFKDFILSGDMEGVVMTYQSCERNGIDPEEQIKAAIGSVKALESAEMKDGITSLQVASERFDEAKSITEKKKMRQKMKKFLSMSEYKAFTQKEALDMVQSYLNGEDDLKEMEKAENKYLMKAKSEDVTEDWRIQAVWNGTMETYDEYLRLKDVDKAKANAFKNSKTNKRLFAARKAISAAKKKMNKAKKQMDGQNDAAKMVEIRKTRKELLKTLNEME